MDSVVMELRYSSRPTMGVEYMVTEPSYVGSRKTYIEKMTSSMVTGSPSENFRSSRSLMS